MDRDDPLAGFRDEFNFPLPKDGRAPVYLCGNSLGVQPKLAVEFVNEELATASLPPLVAPAALEP